MNVSRMASVLCLLGLAGGTATAQETAPAMSGWDAGSTLPKTGPTPPKTGTTPAGRDKQVIKAIYIPLADHYAGIIAYEKYRGKMKLADYQIERMKSWPLLRAYFMSGEVDMAYVMCPLAMDMFRENSNFRWIGLMHRDGNALAINDLLNVHVNLPTMRIDRKPDAKVAEAFAKAKREFGQPTECGMPDLLATHTVVLYKYLKEHGKTLGIGRGRDKDVVAIAVPPPKAPAFLKKNNSRGIPASFEQSLPWADVVVTQNFGRVAWQGQRTLNPLRHKDFRQEAIVPPGDLALSLDAVL